MKVSSTALMNWNKSIIFSNLSSNVIFTFILKCCTQSGYQPQVDLVKFDYKKNKILKGILLYFDDLLEPAI